MNRLDSFNLDDSRQHDALERDDDDDFGFKEKSPMAKIVVGEPLKINYRFYEECYFLKLKKLFDKSEIVGF